MGSANLMEVSKSKNTTKKSGRVIAQEEEDMDKILAELGEGPPIPKPPQEEKVNLVQLEPELGESAAARKRRKKKEKEKAKKAAAVVEVKEGTQEGTKSTISDKKVPKHVREMQEELERRAKAEERKKKEEEERLRKEEEELHRQEELDRQEEEARQKKKEKRQKRRQEGKLLTEKQKEDARRLEVKRNQYHVNDIVINSANSGRPNYQTKKAKRAPAQANKESGTVNEDAMELEKVRDVEVKHELERKEIADEEWDAKSWDNADVNLLVKGALADGEEVESESKSEPVIVVRKEIKQVILPSGGDAGSLSGAITRTASITPPMEVQVVDCNNDNGPSVEVVEKNGKNYSAMKQQGRTLGALLESSTDNLRSPICCIMGHVDCGKTKLLDCIRGTKIQEGEAGGITQQIGATFIPSENIREKTKELKADAKLQVPGVLVIDTPGHESFKNLRSRGSHLCDIAILVVDIMHDLKPQTIESLNLLRDQETKFIVALNKVDRLFGWKTFPDAPFVKSIKQQSKDVQNEFKIRLTQIITQFKEQGLNTELYNKNKEMGDTVSIVPTSAISGEGIPDMLLLLVYWTQKAMVERLTFSNKVECTVLEVKVSEGLGTTIDVILFNGVLHEGDQIVVRGMQEPVVTTIRALWTPPPMKELRIKSSYLRHKELKAAQGIRISAQGLEHAIAGSRLFVVGPEDDVDDIKKEVMEEPKDDVVVTQHGNVEKPQETAIHDMSKLDKTGKGVYVQASTRGSLEALLEYLNSSEVNIPVSGTNIGPVHKRDVRKAALMLERKKEFATILAFDVEVIPEARQLADEIGLKIFIADTIYDLCGQFKAYINKLSEEKKKEAAEVAVFPCRLRILPNCVYNKKDPILLGVNILEGIAKVGTPICFRSKDSIVDIGRIASIEINQRQVDVAKKGQEVAIKISSTNQDEKQKMFGRHFGIHDVLLSRLTRKSIDILKENYRGELSKDDWYLVKTLKGILKIQ